MTNKPLEVLKKYFGFDSFRDPQESVINSTLSKKDTLALAATGTGKALHKDTLLQTSNGAITMGSVNVGDFVLGKDGRRTKVLAKFQPMTKDHYLITFRDGTEVKACGDHLWYVDLSNSTSNQNIFDTKTLYKKLNENALNISIPLTNCVTDYPEQNLPTDPYVLGLCLGGISYNTSQDKGSSLDFEFYKNFMESFEDSLSLCKELLKKRNSKNIPFEFLYSSVEQRKKLLSGLLDANGFFEKNCSVYCTDNKKLIDQVSILCNSLGYSTTLLNESSLQILTTDQLFSLPRKATQVVTDIAKTSYAHHIQSIVKIEDDAEDYFCITVDNEDKLYLITDKFIPTHNTAMFQIPALCLDGLTVVISPLKSLQKDQVDNCKAKGIPVALINSDTGKRERARIIKEISEKTLKILYVSPETLFGDNFSDVLAVMQNVKLLAVDEAHCCSAWSDFRPKYREIYKAREQFFPDAVLLAVTATADQAVIDDIIKYLGFNKDFNFFKTSFDRPTIEYKIIKALPNTSPFTTAAKIIKKEHDGQAGILFCGTQKKCEESATFLKALGFKAKHYHAKLKKSEKEEIQDQFLKGEIDIICATIAFGMGIDKPDVRFVIHLDAPNNFDDYSQQVGRASRDRLPSVAYLIYDPSSYRASLWLLQKSTLNPERLKVKIKKLQEFHNFCKSNSCRRRTMLEYFGEKYTKNNCGSCDICKGRAV